MMREHCQGRSNDTQACPVTLPNDAQAWSDIASNNAHVFLWTLPNAAQAWPDMLSNNARHDP
jgi:hypothetical protein